MTRDDALNLMQQYSYDLFDLLGRLWRPDNPERYDIISDAECMYDRFPDSGSERKAMRWLGYMQGVLVACGVYTLDEVKEHSRTRRVGA